MNRSLFSVALVAALAGVCQAQEPLDAREQAFVAAVSQVAGNPTPEFEKESDSEGTLIEIEFSDEFELRLVRYSDADMAKEAAGMAALYSSMGDAPTLVELRGNDVLVFEGPLAEGEMAETMRKAAWGALPWDNGTKSTSLFMLNLLEGGMALRCSSQITTVYRHLQELLAEAIDEAADAEPGDDEQYEVISPREVKVSQDGGASGHIKLTDAAALHVVAPEAPSAVLKSVAEFVGLPLAKSATTGIAGEIGAR